MKTHREKSAKERTSMVKCVVRASEEQEQGRFYSQSDLKGLCSEWKGWCSRKMLTRMVRQVRYKVVRQKKEKKLRVKLSAK